MTQINVKPPFIKLEQFLKFAGAVATGGEAKNLIGDGLVKLNGEVCLMRGKKLFNGDVAEICNGSGEKYECLIVQ